MISFFLPALISYFPTPHTPHPTPHFPTPHFPAFKQNLRLLAQTGQKMIVSDIGIIWLRKNVFPCRLLA
ncbi:MAG: hypothetical protein EWV75_07910 [Microcystis wesenbergii Mw_QC_S_20081001_S30D]|uniref:Uncharacterized protein n=1 Tax=Microcystis wesenbergii Mw_QC_S_20081001_S30D TaxID=2486245 RepID=A0A552JQK8_9CHRO|nr:hypothetical protein [Microcystis aeruginosa W11-03]NCR94319.1 hypothetical protein [Microcystis aeruginosa W11-06]TRU98019.1 MAG: hypothetical protein EWV75_07910 [Microcystis wesenbergii Mw_QC_S_20081001_S30D]TRU99224.1 MAG: hypothetical protein EWV73_13715 [Microcystis wesenbergii Mw_QC_B_20070930_S4D]